MSRDILTVDELAEMLAVKPKTIRQWVFLKKIPFFHMGRLLRFRRDSILDWTSQLEAKTQDEIKAAPAPKQAKAKTKAASSNQNGAQRKRTTARKAGNV